MSFTFIFPAAANWRRCLLSLLVLASFLVNPAAWGQDAATECVADVLRQAGKSMQNPQVRARVIQQMKTIQKREWAEVEAKARRLGVKTRKVGPDGRIYYLGDFRGDQPMYITSRNREAAISTNVTPLLSAPYNLDGSGVIVGLWDGGAGSDDHHEFGGRLVIMDGSEPNSHASHCAGTIGATGVTAKARGMAPAVTIHSYDFLGGSDLPEMTSRAATASGNLATDIYLSSHSYGYSFGWKGNAWSGTGTDQNAVDEDWGRYDDHWSVRHDALAYNAPYYLQFRAAGNEAEDNPATGSDVVIGKNTVPYDPAIHPPGDGRYLNGFGTIGMEESAKNIVLVGAVYDAETNGTRDLSKAARLGYSSTGPTDDGRIKPDLVANGYILFSTDIVNYSNNSGTSMACPNATGSAALLVGLYADLFNGAAMRASTLKGLLIHTADDLGNPGPDYKFGWGLINTQRAADLILAQEAVPDDLRLVEDQVSSSVSTKTYYANWDTLSSEIRATLCWTDPPGTEQGHDSRTPVLVNDLDLKLTAPDGREYYPFVMPYVGDWTTATLDAPATTGVNTVDNVEQVLVNAAPQAGTWTITIRSNGTLINGLQDYGLLLSGLTTVPPAPPSWSGPNISAEDAYNSIPYLATIVGDASDTNNEALTFAKVSGPAWLSVAADGSLSGTPAAADIGTNVFTVSVTDGNSAPVEASLYITVDPGPAEISVVQAHVVGQFDTRAFNVPVDVGPGSVLVAAVYADGLIYAESLRYGNGGGIGNGDVAPDWINADADGRVYLAYWLDPPAGSGWAIRTSNTGGSAAANSIVALWELRGVDLTRPVTTSVQNSTITTDTAKEFIIAAAGQNGDTTVNPSGSSALDTPLRFNSVTIASLGGGTAGGTLSAGDTTAGAAGDYSVDFLNDNYDSPIALAFESLGESAGGTRVVTYRGNGHDGGVVPIDDNNPYSIGASVSVLGNTGKLSRTGYRFAGWNTSADGSGTAYAANDTFTIDAYVSLHAQWNVESYTVSYDGNGSSSGSVPTDPSSPYDYGSSVTVLANSGNLSRPGYSFAGWNTAPDGSGIGYAADDSLTLVSDTTLYAMWTNTTVAYWPFDSISSTAGLSDAIGNYRLSVISGAFTADAAAAVSPVPNPDLNLNFTGDSAANPDAWMPNASLLAPGGSGQDRLTVSNSGNTFDLSGKSFTFEGWVQQNGTTPEGFGDQIGGTRIGSGGWGGYILRLTSTGDMSAFFSDGSNSWGPSTSGTNYIGTGFIHFALVWQDGAGDNGTGKADLYINGVLESSASAPAGWSAATADSNASDFGLGGRAVDGNTWDGRFDEFRFTGAALDPSLFLNAIGGDSYTLTFDANGGTTPVPAGKSVILGASYGTLATTSRTGFTWVGWFTAPTGGSQVTAATTVTTEADHTLYAQWAANPAGFSLSKAAANVVESGGTDSFTVVLDAEPASDVVFDLTSSDTNEATVSPATLTFTSGNWNTPQTVTISGVADATISNDSATVTVSVNDAASLDSYHALADQSVLVNCIDDDDEFTLTVVAGTGGVSVTGAGTKDPGNAPYPITATAATGYSFVNWTVTAGSASFADASSASTTVSASEDATVQANFTPETYTVRYDGNAADSGTPPEAQSKIYGEDLTLATNTGGLTRAGYQIIGWNTDADGTGTAYAPGGIYSSNEGVLLYAHWQAESIAPEIAQLSPSDEETGVATEAVLLATFNEPIVLKDGGTITITDLTDGSSTLAITLPDARVTSPNGDDLAVDLTANLDHSTDYEVTIDESAVEDLAPIPNAYAGTLPGEWTFRTAPAGASIAWVTKQAALNSSWQSLLEGAGHSVTYFGEGYQSLDLSEAAMLNTYDLVIASGDADLGTGWEWVSVPMINMNPYRMDELGWISTQGNLRSQETSVSVLDASDPIWNGMGLSNGDSVQLWTTNVRFNGDSAGNLLGSPSPIASKAGDSDDVGIVRWGAGDLPDGEGPRMQWRSPAGGDLDAFTLTADGQTAFLNAVAHYTNTSSGAYIVTYDGNGSTGGSVPVDGTSYPGGAEVTVLDNIGGLTRTGYNFAGWNTDSAGTGAAYTAGDAFPISGDTTLYAQWTVKPALTITAASNSKVYDGMPLTDSGYSLTAGSLEPGHSLVSVSVSGSQTNVGSSDNVPGNALIQDDSSNDVTGFYAIDYADGLLTVTQATPTVDEWPTASPITKGQVLSASGLIGGSASVAGTFGFDSPSTSPGSVGSYAAAVTFTPDDSTNYASVSGTVDVAVIYSDYADYVADNVGTSNDPTADGNNNGVRDGLEYAFYGALGAGVKLDSPAKLQQVAFGSLEETGIPNDSSDNRLKFSIRLPEHPPGDVAYQVYASSLSPGDSNPTLLARYNGSWTLENDATMEPGAGSEDVIVDGVTPADSARRFLWLEIEFTP